MNNLNFSPEQMDSLLKLASQKLGKQPDEIKNQLEQGNLNSLIGGLDPGLQNKISALANNPQAIDNIMKNAKMANMLSGLMGGKK